MDRFTWGIVAGVLLLVIGGLATAIMLPGRTTSSDPDSPDGVTLAYAQALQDGDPDRAWNMLAPEAQAQTTRERFLRVTTRGGPRWRLSAEAPTDQGEEAVVVLVRTFSTGGGLFPSGPVSERFTVRLKRDGASWKVLVPPDPYVLSPGA